MLFHRKNRIINTIIFLFFLSATLLSKINSFGQDTLSVLFLGNSYTSANNLPQLVKDLTNSTGKTLITDAHMPGGYTLSNHLTDVISLNKIKQGKWNYVVIQEQSQIPSIDHYRYNSMYPSLTALKDSIERYNPCAGIITYMTWGRRFGGMQCDPSSTYCSPAFTGFNHMQDSLASAYLQISRQLNIQCAPVGIVWKNILNDTSLVLHTGDNSHPNTEGSYVAACAIYSSIWKKRIAGSGFTAGLSSALSQYYQRISDSTIFGNPDNWNLFINDPTAGFSESISGYTVSFSNLSASIHDSLNYFWSFGDGSTSVQKNPIHTYATAGDHTISQISSNCIFSDTATKTIRIAVTDTTSNTNNEIIVYPNPTSDRINLKTGNSYWGSVYSVYDITGRTVINGIINTENSIIDLKNLSAGVYLLAVRENSQHRLKTYKVIKK